MEELDHSCSGGWPGGPGGFVVPVIQQHHLGVLCTPGSEQGSVGVGHKRAWVVAEETLGSEYSS